MSARHESLSGSLDVPFPEWEACPPAEPLALVASWLHDAETWGCSEPRGATVSTVDDGYGLSARMMTLVETTAGGLLFATHDTSRKAQDISSTGAGNALFYWREVGRQLSVAGRFERVGEAKSEALWRSRHPSLHPMSSLSRQSDVLTDADELRSQARRLEEGLLDADGNSLVERPARYAGYQLTGDRIEFWSSASDRLHRRLLYLRSGGQWSVQRLQP